MYSETYLSCLEISQDSIIQEMMLNQMKGEDKERESTFYYFILCKYILKSFLDENKPTEARQFFFVHFPWLEHWIVVSASSEDPFIPLDPNN